jgi:hypothetical protein
MTCTVCGTAYSIAAKLGHRSVNEITRAGIAD